MEEWNYEDWYAYAETSACYLGYGVNFADPLI